ncbi:hypothetical protein IAT38_003905 [Cryptococcus sp. DSM 104549]
MRLPLDFLRDSPSSEGTPSVYSPASDSESSVSSASSSPSRKPTKRRKTATESAKSRASPSRSSTRRPRSGADSDDYSASGSGSASESDSGDEVYTVEHILSRSLARSKNPETGKTEYQYLVRWEGWAPKDDTWEYKSSLLEGSALLVEEFDDLEHLPFTILASRPSLTHAPSTYLVRYGLVSPSFLPSPLYEKAWHTPNQIQKHTSAPKSTVQLAIDKFTQEEEQEGSARVRGASPRKVQLQKERCVLEILEREEYGPEDAEDSEGEDEAEGVNYLVRWRDRRHIKEEWMDYEKVVFVFEEDGREFVRKWDDKRGFGGRRLALREKEENVNDYERERLKNIEENKKLLQSLGF